MIRRSFEQVVQIHFQLVKLGVVKTKHGHVKCKVRGFSRVLFPFDECSISWRRRSKQAGKQHLRIAVSLFDGHVVSFRTKESGGRE